MPMHEVEAFVRTSPRRRALREKGGLGILSDRQLRGNDFRRAPLSRTTSLTPFQSPKALRGGSMTVKDEVAELVRRMAPFGVCDDCIADKLGLSVRQHEP